MKAVNAALFALAVLALSPATPARAATRPLTVRCAVTLDLPNGASRVETLVGVQADQATFATIDRRLALMDDNPLRITVAYDGDAASIDLLHDASDTAFH